MVIEKIPIGNDILTGDIVYIEDKEEPIISIIGKKRMGMSFMTKRLSYYYHKAGYKVLTLNDRVNDCGDMKEFKTENG